MDSWASPLFQAKTAAWVLSTRSSFFRMWLTWFFTVFSERTIFRAISPLLSPWEIQ